MVSSELFGCRWRESLGVQVKYLTCPPTVEMGRVGGGKDSKVRLKIDMEMYTMQKF